MSDSTSKGLDEKYCSECGSVIKVKAEICPKCGVRQFISPASISIGPLASNGKSRIVTAFLALFLGTFGAHKFYLGQTVLGIIYLVFCWTWIPTVVSFVEFILLLIMSDVEFDQKYGRA
jgi:TM2 domain-containing membrane protein YozV